jgi:hypothetical protein
MDILTLGKISQVKRDTDKKIADLDAVVMTALTATTENVDQNIALAVCNLNTALEDTELSLNTAMDTLDTNLTGQVTTLDNATSTSLTAMSTTLSNCMTCIDQDVGACFAANAGSKQGVLHVHGSVRTCNGKCCSWTVPTGVSKATFEFWGGGGAGAGHCCYGCWCSFNKSNAAQAGSYATKTIDVTEGWSYSLCAGYGAQSNLYCRCGRQGCASYGNGCGIGVCATGGNGGCVHYGWGGNTTSCDYVSRHCEGNGGSFGITAMGSGTFKEGRPHSYCRCGAQGQWMNGAPLIGVPAQQYIVDSCGCCGRCTGAWPSGGGMSNMKTWCGRDVGNCTGAPGYGGLVKVSYS